MDFEEYTFPDGSSILIYDQSEDFVSVQVFNDTFHGDYCFDHEISQMFC